MNKKKTGIIAACVLVLLVAVFAIVFCLFKPKTSQGSKAITIEVVDNNGASKNFKVKTDAEYLRQAMEETKGLEFSGTESEYGMMVETVNGVTADYAADGAYWAFYVNGEYGMYGVDSQPVTDGDAFKIVYEVFVG